MENIDPIGIHTGDSFVVAPTQTLTNKECQMLRSAALKIIKALKIEGGCNVQFALDTVSNQYYVIEVNPRIQGTFECVEKAYGINMLEAHIKACQGEIIEIGNPKYYAYKKIVYSPTRMKYSKIDLDNIYDTPHIGSITEKSEPLLTIIDKNKVSTTYSNYFRKKILIKENFILVI